MLHVVKNLSTSFLFLLLPLRNCAMINKYSDWNEDTDKPSLDRRHPFPWSEITVPNHLQFDDEDYDKESRNYESFKVFVYVILSIIFSILVYYTCRHCMKVCGKEQHRTVNVRARRYNYTRVNENSAEERSLHQGHNNSRRNQRMTLILNFESPEGQPLAVQCSDKPPDYFTVVRNDFSAKEAIFLDAKSPTPNTAEIPPPAYNANV